MCLDKRKFGDPGKKKKQCQQRACVANTQKHGIQITQKDLDKQKVMQSESLLRMVAFHT